MLMRTLLRLKIASNVKLTQKTEQEDDEDYTDDDNEPATGKAFLENVRKPNWPRYHRPLLVAQDFTIL